MTAVVGRRGRPRARAVGLVAVLSASLAIGASAQAQEDDPPVLSVETGLTPVGRLSGSKSLTGRVAETDPALLGRTDGAPIEVVVKLDYDPLATYQGTLPGLEATSPSVTGEKLDVDSGASLEYDAFAADQEAAFLDDLAAVVPDAQVGQSLRTVYGGVALTIPANSVEDVLAIPNVVAVQQDKLNQPTTDSSGEFIGADFVYPDLGGPSNAGAGIIFGVLDTGAWPEHPSFANQGNLGAPPPKADGTPRVCDFGDNPLTTANDPFVCQNKLIGGRPVLATYLSSPARAAAEPFHTARDSDGHGTHTGSTAAGNALASAPVLGVERGPLAGIAPGAWVSVYKVCGIVGCYDSDTAAAVARAIEDGVDVINFSISGGTDPATDPTEQAFLDAYAAGVFVAASGGNDGPGAGTVNHLSPWTTTVAASTQTREFRSTLSLTASNGDTYQVDGASITAGAGPLPVVLSSAAPYSRPLCDAPAPAGLFTGKIVACQRGVNARVDKGYNVAQGGAAGMILYNPALADIETDTHWLPTVHLADGGPFVAFMNGHTGVTGSFTAGVAVDGQGDVMAAFSSRGPGGPFIKPDITAPGVQILAGDTPMVESISSGPPGEYFQAIAGTSMSGPHIAGSAILMADLHPTWSPAEIKSALMSTAVQNVVKEDLTTPADPFDMGSGRVYLANAELTGLTLDETAVNMAELGTDPINAVHLNLASIYAPVFPGMLTTSRTFTNVSSRRLRYDVEVAQPADTTITVSPRRFTLQPGDSAKVEITIESTNADENQFGEIRLIPRNDNYAPQHLTVGFTLQQGVVELSQSCLPTDPLVGDFVECDVTAQNNSFEEAEVDLRTTMNNRFRIVDVEGPVAITSPRSAELHQTLEPAELGVPSVDPGTIAGYIPLDAFGVVPDPIGDEDFLGYNVPAYVYNGETYTTISVNSNGYLVAGEATSEDNNCCDLPDGPDPAPPNNMLAPFWTDLDGTGAPGILATVLTDGINDWLVIEHRVNVFGTTSPRVFQTWIGLNGVQDIAFAYNPANRPANPGQDFLVGAENATGEGDVVATLPTQDLRVESTDPAPGGSVTYGLTLRATSVGQGLVRTEMTTSQVPGVTVERDDIFVYPR